MKLITKNTEMKKIKMIAGVMWALAGLLAIIILFPGIPGLSTTLAKAPFMKIHPRYSGGEEMQEIVTDCCTLDVRKPVFNGLIGDRKEGFVQLDWRGSIPEVIQDTIDYNLDGTADFYITVNTGSREALLTGLSKKVKDIRISTPTSYGWAVRVNLEK